MVMPAWIVTIMPAFIHNERFIMAPAIDHAWLKADRHIAGAVEITKVIGAKGGPDKKRVQHNGIANGIVGRIDIARADDDHVYGHGRIEHAAARHGVIPIAGDKDIAVRGPAIVGRDI